MDTQNARVVVGVDGSPGSRPALVMALLQAARRGADLDVVVACPLVEPWGVGAPILVPDVEAMLADARARGQAQLAEARDHPALTDVPGIDDIRVAVVVVERQPGPALVERSATADLLVVGSRGHGAARSTLLGSVALHCATRAHCPVLIVHADPGAAPSAAPVVVGLDESASAREALRQAAEEARLMGADLEVVMAYLPMSYWGDLYAVMGPPAGQDRERLEHRGRAIIREVLGSEGAGTGARLVTEEGAPGNVLVRRAADATLLVVGSACRHRLEGMFLGSVALHCAIHASCPVLVVHPPRDPVPQAPARATSEPAPTP